jgi:hypothetical protein
MENGFNQTEQDIGAWATGKINEESGIDELFNQTEAILIFFHKMGPFINGKEELARKIIDVLTIVAASDKEWRNVRQANYIIYLCSDLEIHEPIKQRRNAIRGFRI